MMTPFGLDFGTTNSVLAYFDSGAVKVVPIDEPPAEWAQHGFDCVLPSVLAHDERGAPVFGWRAKRQPSGKLEAVKRLFATDDAVQVGSDTLAIEQAAALLFRRIKDGAGGQGLSLDRSVVTIPANSRGLARFRTKICAGLAGIEVPALINEPTAAAMAHSLEAEDDEKILVFDWGGGTLDVTVLQVTDGMFMELASKGIQQLGGIDVDKAFAAAIIQRLGQPPTWTAVESGLFQLEVEWAKILLSSQTSTNIRLPDGTALEVGRDVLDAAARPLVEQSLGPIHQCLRDLRIAPKDVQHVVMVGGSSKLALARELVTDVMQRAPSDTCDPMTAIAQGAAVAAAILAGQLDRDFSVATEHALGTITHDDRDVAHFATIIPRNRHLPAKATDSYSPKVVGQTHVRIRVIEGDPDVPLDHPDNVILKEWEVALRDPNLPVEQSMFDMTYEYDVDGILHVVVADKLTGSQLLQDDVSFGVSRDKTELVRIARWVEAVSSGLPSDDEVSASPAPPSGDAELLGLVDKMRGQVVPFVDDVEAKRLLALCADLEHSTGPAVSEAKERLQLEMRKYSYLV